MSSYYYLVAQLPYLMYGQAAPMSSDQFAALAKDMLDPADAALLELCSLDPEAADGDSQSPSYAGMPAPTPSSFLNRWREWERALRLHLARYRAQKIKRDNGAPVDPPENPLEAGSVAKAAMAMESPLEAEQYLDKARWDAIETLEGLDHFGRNTVYAYLLKLFLMERRSLFTAEEGFSEYKALYASILEARYSEAGSDTGPGGQMSDGPQSDRPRSENSIESGEAT
ncbi:DUF2764 domain-containing protein [Breznakiella homolactica]|uniref:DUF2764 family protein n=1 Tax=Breznakiella homolactica TaxID=2798577 RepID=A0A7T8BAH4_9SPIR|nr:DUF2764 domain-containing protein [Breznakiella homolactica]QQO08223.1 DUF2764 domain-containing protein [Breznakiella homolactica]